MARKLLQAKRHDVEMNLRGVLRGFGLKVGPTTPRSFEARVRELAEGHLTLETVAGALLAARAELLWRFKDLEKRLVAVGAMTLGAAPFSCCSAAPAAAMAAA